VVAFTAPTGGPISPGSAAETLNINLTSNITQKLASLTGTMAHDASGNVLDDVTGNPVVGCLASWFSPGTPAVVSGPGGVGTTWNATNTGTFTLGVTMPANTVDQSVCENINPRVVVTAVGG
jgi:hypothetical protein